MKQKTKSAPKNSFNPDVKTFIPEWQLAAIAAIILAFNELEATIDQFFFLATELDSSIMWDVSTRIGGYEGKIAIIKKAIVGILEATEWTNFAEAIGAGCYGAIKEVRDALAHVRHLNIQNNVGQMLKKNKDADAINVLVSKDVLEKAYAILVSLNREIHGTLVLVANIKILKKLNTDDPEKEQRELAVRDSRAQVRQFRTYRLSLPPIPECPSESELHEAERQAQITHLMLTIPGLAQWHMTPHSQLRYHTPAIRNMLGIQSTPLPLMESLKKK